MPIAWTVLAFVQDEAQYVYYDDDGIGVNNQGNRQVKTLRLIRVDPEGRR